MPFITRPRIILVTCSAVALAGGVAYGASSSRSLPPPSPYDRFTLSQRQGPVVGAPGATGFPRASIVVPKAWKRLARRTDSITFRSSSTACPFTVRFGVRLAAGAPATAVAHVAAAVPAPGPRNVQDEGTRGPTAWRVVRLTSTPTLKGIDALHAYATSSGVVGMPAGQRAWVELTARARSAPANECHAGSFRTVSRQIGDAMSVSRR